MRSKLHGAPLLTLLLLLLHPLALSGQNARTLSPGDEVRVHAPSVRPSRIRGTVVLYQGSTLELQERETGQILDVPVAEIRSLALNEGLHRGRSSWYVARFGAFLGGAGGLVAGPLIATSRAPGNFGEVMLVSGIVGTAAGTGLGAILGAVFARDHWQRFRMPIVPTVSSAEGSFGVSLRAAVP